VVSHSRRRPRFGWLGIIAAGAVHCEELDIQCLEDSCRHSAARIVDAGVHGRYDVSSVCLVDHVPCNTLQHETETILRVIVLYLYTSKERLTLPLVDKT
jgi:hypothetical protein